MTKSFKLSAFYVLIALINVWGAYTKQWNEAVSGLICIAVVVLVIYNDSKK